MLLLTLKTSIAALILAIGISAATDDIVYLWRRPFLLVKSIVAMYLVMHFKFVSKMATAINL